MWSDSDPEAHRIAFFKSTDAIDAGQPRVLIIDCVDSASRDETVKLRRARFSGLKPPSVPTLGSDLVEELRLGEEAIRRLVAVQRKESGPQAQ
jgi:hypothetical protein